MFVQGPLRVVGLYPGLGMQYEMCFADLRRGLNTSKCQRSGLGPRTKTDLTPPLPGYNQPLTLDHYTS